MTRVLLPAPNYLAAALGLVVVPDSVAAPGLVVALGLAVVPGSVAALVQAEVLVSAVVRAQVLAPDPASVVQAHSIPACKCKRRAERWCQRSQSLDRQLC